MSTFAVSARLASRFCFAILGPMSENTSVIIATHNRPKMLKSLLESVACGSTQPGEVVVVDDGSTVPVAEEIGAGLPFRFRLLRHDTARGPGTARNTGVHASRGSIILFTDDDCTVDRDWVSVMSGRVERAKGTQLGGVGGAVRAAGRDLFSRYYDFHKILEPRPHDAANPNRIPYMVTANCGVRRDVFMRAGGFDTRIPTAGGEDAAFSIRIVKRGFYLEHEPRALVYHHYRASIVDFAKTFYRYGLGGRYVVDRHLPL